jgi:hypothetical protein
MAKDQIKILTVGTIDFLSMNVLRLTLTKAKLSLLNTYRVLAQEDMWRISEFGPDDKLRT